MRKDVHRQGVRLFGLCCLLVLPLLAFPLFLSAQDDPELGGRELFPTVDRQLSQVLTKANAAVQEKDYSLALELLGPLVTGNLKALDIDLDAEQFAQDYFLPPKKDRSSRTSLKREALKLLGSIPAKELATFETQYGSEADLLLQQGLKEGNAEKLAEAVRRFFHTKAGYKACVALGRYQLELGRPLAAAVYLKRVVETPTATATVEPEASILLAGALMHAGQPDRARTTIANLQKVVARPTLTSRQGVALEFSADKDPLPLLEQLFGRIQKRNPLIQQQWSMFRGNLERNALTEISEPLSTARWSVPVLNDADDEQLIAEQSRQFAQMGTPSLSAIQPLAVRDTVLFRSLNRLLAVDFKSGKRTWDWYWYTPGTMSMLPQFGSNPTDQLRERMWQNAPYGQLSSDGELVFLVDTVHEPSVKLAVNRAPLGTPLPGAMNHLVAISVPKQGSMVWSVGGRTGEHEPQLQGAFFLSPPLVVNGQLYALVELRSAIVLVALDRLSGKLQWKQTLVASEMWYNPRQSQRHISGAMLAYGDGILVCPTSAGVVVGVDLVNRSLAWATPYDKGEANRRNSFLSPRAMPYGEGWLDSASTISNGRVLLTPPETGEVHCLDLFTGNILWSKKRDESLFVAGVQQDIALLVGKKSFVGLSMIDGKKAWDEVTIAPPSGRGLLDAHYYLQPTADRTLVKFDFVAGKIVEEYATSKPLGNLIPYDGNLISLSPHSVDSFYRFDQLESRVNEILAKTPDDPWATARRGELQLHRREFTQAWNTLTTAAKGPKPDPAVNALLVDAGLALLTADYKQHAALVDEISPRLQNIPQQERFYRMLTTGRESLGDRVGAWRALLQLSKILTPPLDTTDAVKTTELVEIDRTLRVRSSRWLAAHAERIYREANAEQQTQIDQLVRAEGERLANDSIPALRRFIEQLGFHPLTDEKRLALVNRLIANGNLLEAELLLQPLLTAANRTQSAQAAALHVNMLMAADRWSEVAVETNRLLRDHPHREVSPGKTAAQFAESISQRPSFRAGKFMVERRYPAGKVEVSEESHRIADDSGDSRKQLHLCRWLQENERFSSSLHAIYNATQDTLVVRDSYGQLLLSVTLKGSMNLRGGLRADPFGSRGSNVVAYSVRMLGHILLVSTGSEILAFDALRFQHDAEANLLWRQPLFDAQNPTDMRYLSTSISQNPWGMPRISLTGQRTLVGGTSQLTAHGVCFFRNRQLVCVDPLSGEPMWQRTDVPVGSELLGDEEFVYAAVPNKNEVQVYRLRDGSLVGTRTITPMDNRIAIHASRVLSWSQAAAKTPESESDADMELRLDDLRTQREVWREIAPAGSRGYLIGSQEVAIVRPNGSFKIRSLADDTILLSAQLEPAEKIKQLVVQRSSDQYLVFVAQPEIHKMPRAIISPAPRTGNTNEVDAIPFAVLMSAKIYAFDRKNGKSMWPSPAIISEMGLPMDQPLDQPVLVLQRNIDATGGQASKRTSSLTLLDKRTGVAIHRDDSLDNEIHAYDLSIDRERPIIKVSIPQKTIALRFTEEAMSSAIPLKSDEAFVGKKEGDNNAKAKNNENLPTSPAKFEDDPFK